MSRPAATIGRDEHSPLHEGFDHAVNEDQKSPGALGRFGCTNEGNELHLIGPGEIAYRLDLTPAQLKITWTALKSLLDDFGHDERDMHELVREVLDKLPDEHSIRAIDLGRSRG